MSKTLTWVWSLSLLVAVPSLASAGLLDWLLPVGKVADTARDITWAVLLKQFLDTWMPLLGTMIVVLAAAGCGIAAKNLLRELADTFRSAMADGRITGAESVFLIPLFFVGGIVALVLAAFTVLFGYLGADALIDLANAPPA